MASNNSKPAAELRIGAVKATVWENEIGGITRHNITFSRLYKDGDQWKTSQIFGRNDLLVLAKVADQATRRSSKFSRAATPRTSNSQR